MRYASIDIGTNSCRLMIADITSFGLQTVHREMNTTRIGAGLAASGLISREAAERTVECLRGYEQIIEHAEVQEYRMVATSAVREASNRTYFEDLCKQRLHKEVWVISGEEEARLTYIGVQKGLRLDQSILVADLGGGSTELIHSNGELFLSSLPLGAVRAAELQPTDSQILAVIADITKGKARFSDAVLVFCGGTATSLVAMKHALKEYDSSLVHGQRLERQEIQEAYQLLRNMPFEARQKVAGLQPQRADIIIYGMQIMLNLMLALDKDWAVVSESDLLEGVIWEISEQSPEKSTSS